MVVVVVVVVVVLEGFPSFLGDLCFGRLRMVWGSPNPFFLVLTLVSSSDKQDRQHGFLLDFFCVLLCFSSSQRQSLADPPPPPQKKIKQTQ